MTVRLVNGSRLVDGCKVDPDPLDLSLDPTAQLDTQVLSSYLLLLFYSALGRCRVSLQYLPGLPASHISVPSVSADDALLHVVPGPSMCHH